MITIWGFNLKPEASFGFLLYHIEINRLKDMGINKE